MYTSVTKMSKKSTNYNKYVANDPVRRLLLKNFLKQLRCAVEKVHPASILDIGCGEGFVLKYLIQQGVKAQMRGLDLSKKAVAIARQQVPGVEFSSGSIYHLPYPDNSADMVLCNEVLEHLERPDKAVAEIMRVSRKYIFCSVPHEPWFMLGGLMGGKYITRFGNHPEHINHWTAWGFQGFLQRHGLHVLKLSALKTFPWILAVCEKEEIPKQSMAYLRRIVKNLKNSQSDFRNDNLYNLVLASARGKTYLDVGCGVGDLAYRAFKRGYKAVGIDLEEDIIAEGNKLYKGIDLYVKSVFDIQEIPGKYDTMSAIDVIEHIQDDVEALKKMATRLSKNGRLIIVVPGHSSLYGIRDRNLGHYRRYTRFELESKLKKAGLHIKRIRSWNMIGVIPYFIFEKIMRKPIEVQLRANGSNPSRTRTIIRKFLHLWMKHIENKVDFKVGLSLICVASRNPNND